MKKSLFLYAALAATLASCSSTDDALTADTQQRSAITFDTPYVGKVTRAGDITSSNIGDQDIYLKGFFGTVASGAFDGTIELIYESAQLKKDDSNGWYATEIAFWQPTYSHFFLATTPLAASLNNDEYRIANIPLAQEIDNTSDPKKGNDLMVATTYVEPSSIGTQVPLNFERAMSRFTVYAYTNPSDVNDEAVKVTSLKLYVPSGSNTYNIHYGAEPYAYWSTYPGTSIQSSAVTAASDLTDNGYQELTLVDDATGVQLVERDSEAKAKADGATQLGNSYFMVPTGDNGADNTGSVKRGNDNLQLYMSITYKQMDKEYTKFVNIQDLHSFSKGYQTNLYIGITNPELMTLTFNSMTVEGWTNGSTKTQNAY